MTYDYLKVTARAALELTREQRQEFLDYILMGKTIGAARELTGISFDAAIGTMNMNIETSIRKFLRKESK